MKLRPNSEPALFFLGGQLGTIGEGRGICCPSPARATAMKGLLFVPSCRRAILGTLPACVRSLNPARPPEPESTCYLPRRGICNRSWIRGERLPVPHSSRVGSQITGCSNLYPLNASQSVSKIRLLVFTVSCFTVNKRALLRQARARFQTNWRVDRPRTASAGVGLSRRGGAPRTGSPWGPRRCDNVADE